MNTDRLSHKIPKKIKNSDVVYMIDEYVRLEEHREILKDHWFKGLSFGELTKKYNLSLTAVKNIIYNIGDEILLELRNIYLI